MEIQDNEVKKRREIKPRQQSKNLPFALKKYNHLLKPTALRLFLENLTVSKVRSYTFIFGYGDY